MNVFEERFSFAGSEPISLTMRLTHLGPIVNDFKLDSEPLSPADVDSPLALRWVGSEPAPFFQPFFAINRAQNWHQFQEALHMWRVGPLHFIYADAYGNIGYQMTGDVPIRASAHSGLAPVPGWTDAYEWQGTIPFELLPQLLNPPRGYIINADQSVAPSSYWDFLKREIGTPGNVRFQAPLAADGYRARRIAELLNETRPHSGETFRAMQLDDVLLSARDLPPLLAEVSMEARELIDVRDWLVSWNGRMEVNSAQAALYALLWRALVEELYADNLHDLSAAGSLPIWVTVQLLAEPSNPWWDDVTTPGGVESRDDILQRALAVAYARAVERLGRNRDAWCWGDLHKATFVNPVSGCNESSIVRLILYPRTADTECCESEDGRLE